MIFPFLRRSLSPILGTFTSQLSKGWSTKYGSTKRSVNRQPGSIRLDDVSNNTSSSRGMFRKKGGAPYSQYPIMNMTMEGSDEYLGGGIRKDMEVRIEEERRGRDSRTEDELDKRASQNLARALYGQPGVSTTEVEHGHGHGHTQSMGNANRNRVSVLNGTKQSFDHV